MDNKAFIFVPIIIIVIGVVFLYANRFIKNRLRSLNESVVRVSPIPVDSPSQNVNKYLMGAEITVPEEPEVSFTITSDGFVNESDFTHVGTYPIIPDALGEDTATFVAHIDGASAQEGAQHVYVFTAFNFGGTGNFGYLIAVNRETKKSVFSISLGDRVKFLGVKVSPITGSESEEIQVMYVTRADGKVGDEAYLGAPTTKRFEVLPDGQIRDL